MAAASTMSAAASRASNPGTVQASAVDAEMSKLRGLQQELHKMRNDLSIVMSQETENEMVLIELELQALCERHQT